MKLDHWNSVIKSYGQVSRLIEDLLPEKRQHPPAADEATELSVEHARIDRLYEAIRLEVAALDRVIREESDKDDRFDKDDRPEEDDRAAKADQEDPSAWARPFVIHFDEMVAKRLSDLGLLRWPSLQKNFYQVEKNGGEAFFDLLQDKLDRDRPFDEIAPYLYCLQHGFKGRYLGQPEEVSHRISVLSARVNKPEGLSSEASAAPDENQKQPWPRAVFIAITGFAIAGFPFCLRFLSNL